MWFKRRKRYSPERSDIESRTQPNSQDEPLVSFLANSRESELSATGQLMPEVQMGILEYSHSNAAKLI
jgi:hypothetical protein